MSERICAGCGKPATGYASVWTRATGYLPYCHGDGDAEPTCYERANWPAEDGQEPLSASNTRSVDLGDAETLQGAQNASNEGDS